MALIDKLTAIGNAIRAKTGGSALIPLADMPSAISVLPGLVETANASLVLVDWDGTLLKSYTPAQVQTLESLPSVSPRTTPLLSFQGWNRTFAEIKAYLTAHADDVLYVGAIYTASDGQDHSDAPAGSGLTATRTYKRASTSITANMFSGYSSLCFVNVPKDTATLGYQNAFYNCWSLGSINVPAGITSVNAATFRGCTGLHTVSLPESITEIGESAFRGCSALKNINLSDSLLSIGNYAFYNCYSLSTVNIPSGVTAIRSSAFQNCGLEHVKLPATVGSIEANAFNGCARLTELDLSALSAVPTLTNANALAGTPSSMIIYVKNAEMLAAFSVATNWSDYASRLRVKENNA